MNELKAANIRVTVQRQQVLDILKNSEVPLSLNQIKDMIGEGFMDQSTLYRILDLFETKKIVITPGLVELGKEEFNSNFEFGKQMAKVCDYVIINGVVNYEALSAGLEFGGFDKSKILRAGSIKQSIEVLGTIATSGDVVLFENDLPDNYT